MRGRDGILWILLLLLLLLGIWLKPVQLCEFWEQPSHLAQSVSEYY